MTTRPANGSVASPARPARCWSACTRLYVFVDGRYHQQADHEVDANLFEIKKLGLGEGFESAILQVLKSEAPEGARIGYEPERMSVFEVESLQKKTRPRAVRLVPFAPTLVEEVRGPIDAKAQPVRALDEKKLDTTAGQKVQQLAAEFETLQIDALLVQTLDELAYVSNLRGSDIPFSATFRGIGLLLPKRLLLGCTLAQVPATVRQARLQAVEFIDAENFWQHVKAGMRIGFDAKTTSAEKAERASSGAGAIAVSVQSPIGSDESEKRSTRVESHGAGVRPRRQSRLASGHLVVPGSIETRQSERSRLREKSRRPVRCLGRDRLVVQSHFRRRQKRLGHPLLAPESEAFDQTGRAHVARYGCVL